MKPQALLTFLLCARAAAAAAPREAAAPEAARSGPALAAPAAAPAPAALPSLDAPSLSIGAEIPAVELPVESVRGALDVEVRPSPERAAAPTSETFQDARPESAAVSAEVSSQVPAASPVAAPEEGEAAPGAQTVPGQAPGPELESRAQTALARAASSAETWAMRWYDGARERRVLAENSVARVPESRVLGLMIALDGHPIAEIPRRVQRKSKAKLDRLAAEGLRASRQTEQDRIVAPHLAGLRLAALEFGSGRRKDPAIGDWREAAPRLLVNLAFQLSETPALFTRGMAARLEAAVAELAEVAGSVQIARSAAPLLRALERRRQGLPAVAPVQPVEIQSWSLDGLPHLIAAGILTAAFWLLSVPLPLAVVAAVIVLLVRAYAGALLWRLLPAVSTAFERLAAVSWEPPLHSLFRNRAELELARRDLAEQRRRELDALVAELDRELDREARFAALEERAAELGIPPSTVPPPRSASDIAAEAAREAAEELAAEEAAWAEFENQFEKRLEARRRERR